MSEYRFNARTDNGVAGWLDQHGQPVRLCDIQTPERIQEHKNALVLLTLNFYKLLDELKEAESREVTRCL